jgi:hypothetical protein
VNEGERDGRKRNRNKIRVGMEGAGFKGRNDKVS